MVSAVSQGLFGQGIIGFFMPSRGAKPTMGYAYGTKNPLVTYSGTGVVSLNEFFFPEGFQTGASNPVQEVKDNFKANWFPMAVQLVAIPTAFRLAKNFGRPVLTQTRRILKQLKLDSVVTV